MKLERVLQLNMSGIDVKFLQSKLAANGFFSERIDSNFGQNLLVAVTNFQRQAGLKADGIVGTLTWNTLMNWGKVQVKEEGITLPVCHYGYDGLKIHNYPVGNQFINEEESEKNTIILFNSKGGSRPDWTISNNSKRFKTSYTIGRKSSSSDLKIWDGVILKAFDDKFTSKFSDISDEIWKQSVGIEICNYGQLSLGDDGRFYNSIHKIVNEQDVVKLDTPFKNQIYFEKYTDLQLENLRKLIIYIINKFKIEIQGKIYDESWFSDSSLNTTGGIRSHSNFSKASFDIFPQKEMIEMLNSL